MTVSSHLCYRNIANIDFWAPFGIIIHGTCEIRNISKKPLMSVNSAYSAIRIVV